jgi:hypothetical protein
VAQCLQWHRKAHSDFSNLDYVFTTESFETFDPQKVKISAVAGAATSQGENFESSSLKIRISDFLKHPGKNENLAMLVREIHYSL